MTDALIVTTPEAAAMANVKPGTIRLWVLRGRLEPLKRGARPLRFRASDVHQCIALSRSDAHRERLEALAQAWADTPETVRYCTSGSHV